jgi:uncharacterized protein (DUF697 family)
MNTDAPLIWLLGKAQSGKTSLVCELTGEARDQVGNGFERATLTAGVYAFPPDEPAVRFLDTRGLEDEAAYNPEADLQAAEAAAHLLLVTVRLEDSVLDGLLARVRALRKQHPDWPLLVVQTRLHDLYEPGQPHILPYPFTGTPTDATLPGLSDEFTRLLTAQRQAFNQLPGKPPLFVPVDFTRPDAGLPPANYGAEALWDALHTLLPGVYERLHTPRDPAESARRQIILPWAFAAAGADALPLPLLGGLASTGLQARMVHAVAARFGLEMKPALWAKFTSLLGASFAARYAVRFFLRQGLKIVPGIGAAAVAVLSFGVTYALGEAAIYFCRELSAGREPDREHLRQTYAQNLERAREIWRQRNPPEAGA